MNEWYQINGMQPESCSFAGNGSVNPLGASGTASAFAAETSCVASPSATFTPTLPSGLATASSGSGSSGSSDSGSNGAVPVLGEGQVLLGMMSVALIGVASGIWTLT